MIPRNEQKLGSTQVPFNSTALLTVLLLFSVVAAFVAYIIRASTRTAQDAGDNDVSVTEPDTLEVILTCRCGARVPVSPEFGGKLTQCPNCRNSLRIPKVA